MSEEERQTEVEIPDIIDDTEQYQENDYCSIEITDSELSIIKDSEEGNPEEQCTTSEEQCTTSEQYQENDYYSTEITDSELSIIKDSEEGNPEEQCTTSEEQCTTSEQYQENDYCSTEITDSELSIIKDSEEANPEEQCTNSEKKTQNANKVEVIRSTRLPIARIKNIMKMDPDVTVVNAEAVFLVTKATEMFLETIAKETYAYTAQHKRKTIAKKDLDVVINKVDCLCFLEGAMDF